MKLLNPPPMTMPKVIRAMSVALRRSIQRQVTGPVGQEPEVHQAVDHPQQHGYGQEFDVLGIPEARPVGQQEDTGQPDEPAAPDGDRCGIPDHVRVGQGARRNPVPYGIHAGPQQAGAPGPEPPARMRSDIADRMPPPPAAQSRGATTDNLHPLPGDCQSKMYQSD